MNQLGRQIPVDTLRKDGWFMVLRQDGTINAAPDLGAYQTSAPVLPPSTNWLAKAIAAIKRMYLNDAKGDCVIASLFHLAGVWTGNEVGTPLQGTDAEVAATYAIWNPGRQDNGCDISTVNNYWRDHGVTINGQLHKIDSYVAVDNTNWDLVKAAIALGFMLKLGIDLPGAWEQTNDGGVWDVTSSRVVGGHDVPAIDFNDTVGATIATWAGTRTITKKAFTSKQYITEAYGILSPDWYSAAQTAPNGIDVTTLKADLALIAAGQIPSIGPPSVPMDWIM